MYMRGRTAKTGAGRRGVVAGRRGVGAGRRGDGRWETVGWEKNSLGKKLMLYMVGDGRTGVGGGLETVRWEMGESTPCPPLIYIQLLNTFQLLTY